MYFCVHLVRVIGEMTGSPSRTWDWIDHSGRRFCLSECLNSLFADISRLLLFFFLRDRAALNIRDVDNESIRNIQFVSVFAGIVMFF